MVVPVRGGGLSDLGLLRLEAERHRCLLRRSSEMLGEISESLRRIAVRSYAETTMSNSVMSVYRLQRLGSSAEMLLYNAEKLAKVASERETF